MSKESGEWRTGEQDRPGLEQRWDGGRSTIFDADRDGILGRDLPCTAAGQRDDSR